VDPPAAAGLSHSRARRFLPRLSGPGAATAGPCSSAAPAGRGSSRVPSVGLRDVPVPVFRARPATHRHASTVYGQFGAPGSGRVPAPRGRDARVVHRLLDERHRAAGPARRPRRPQARAPAHPVRHARPRAHADRGAQEERHRGRRSAGEVSPPRRQRRLRLPGAYGTGLLAAISAGGRPGELRLHRRRQRGGLPVHRGPVGRPGHRDVGRHRRGDRPVPGELRRAAGGAGGAALPPSEPAGERLLGHRRGHGHEHPAPQPARGGRGLRAPHRPPRLRRRRPHGVREGAGLPHRGLRARRGRHPGGLRDRAPRSRSW